jgi:DNA-binding CsgD family transcriptional regulator
MKKGFISLHRELDFDLEWGFIDGEFQTKVHPRKHIPLTEKENKLVTLLFFLKDRKEICQILGMSRNALRQAIWRLKKKASQ